MQLLLVSDPVNNSKKLDSHSVTKQEVSKYPAGQNPTYEIDSLEKESDKNLFAKTGSSVDKKFSCPRIKISKSRTLLLNAVKLECQCQILLNNGVKETQTFPTFTLIYLTLQEYLILWFWIRTPEPMRGQAVSLSKSKRQKLQRLDTQDAPADRSLRNLSKGNNLPVSKVRQLLLSKTSYTKFTLATQKLRKMKAFFGSKKEFGVWILLLEINWQKIIMV